MHPLLGRTAAVGAAIVALLLGSAGISGATAGMPRTTPNPEPNFPIGLPGAAPATAVVATSGTAFLAYTAYNSSDSFGSVYVCTVPRGARACSKTTLLPPLNSKISASGGPVSMLIASNGYVDILVTTYPDTKGHQPDGQYADTIKYVVGPGGGLIGKTGVRVGTLDSQGDAIFYGRQIVWVSGSDDTGQGGLTVQATPGDGTFPHFSDPVSIDLAGTPAAKEFYFYGGDVVALPNKDLLLAWDDSSNAYAVEVNPANKYKVVGSSEWKGEVTTTSSGTPTSALATGPSGTYLLLRQSTDGFSGKLELLKYTSSGHFGTPVSVPATTADYGDMTLYELGSGALRVFYETYAGTLVQDSSSDGGAKWTTYTFESGIPEISSNAAAALLRFGAGVVFEGAGGTPSDGVHARVQPVLVHQLVSLIFKSTKLTPGQTTTASGLVGPADSGQKVDVQEDEKTGWVTIGSATETASGSWSLTVKAPSATGTYNYRAEATPVAGWFFTDYSPTHSIVVAKTT